MDPLEKVMLDEPEKFTYASSLLSDDENEQLCDALKPGGPLNTRQPAEYKWMSGYPTPLQKIGQSLLCTGSST